MSPKEELMPLEKEDAGQTMLAGSLSKAMKAYALFSDTKPNEGEAKITATAPASQVRPSLMIFMASTPNLQGCQSPSLSQLS